MIFCWLRLTQPPKTSSRNVRASDDVAMVLVTTANGDLGKLLPTMVPVDRKTAHSSRACLKRCSGNARNHAWLRVGMSFGTGAVEIVSSLLRYRPTDECA